MSGPFSDAVGFGASYHRNGNQWVIYTMPDAKRIGSIDGYDKRRLDWIVEALRAAHTNSSSLSTWVPPTGTKRAIVEELRKARGNFMINDFEIAERMIEAIRKLAAAEESDNEPPPQSQMMGIPAGWKLVPVKPTEDMLDAALGVHESRDGEDEEFFAEFRRTYRAMIKAAPDAQPAPADKLVGGAEAFELAAKLIEDHCIMDTSAGKVLAPRQEGNRDGLHYAVSIRALSDQPAPADNVMAGDIAQAGCDIRILLAQIDWLEELTGEKIEGEDAALVSHIRQSWPSATEGSDTRSAPTPMAHWIEPKCSGSILSAPHA